jgi:hypothetical protein
MKVPLSNGLSKFIAPFLRDGVGKPLKKGRIFDVNCSFVVMVL